MRVPEMYVRDAKTRPVVAGQWTHAGICKNEQTNPFRCNQLSRILVHRISTFYPLSLLAFGEGSETTGIPGKTLKIMDHSRAFGHPRDSKNPAPCGAPCGKLNKRTHFAVALCTR